MDQCHHNQYDTQNSKEPRLLPGAGSVHECPPVHEPKIVSRQGLRFTEEQRLGVSRDASRGGLCDR